MAMDLRAFALYWDEFVWDLPQTVGQPDSMSQIAKSYGQESEDAYLKPQGLMGGK